MSGVAELLVSGPAAGPYGITCGPDGRIARITVTGAVTTFPALHGLPAPGAAPVGIAADRDGVWFVEIGAGQIGRVDRGGIVERPLPASEPHGITVGPDGAVYVALETGAVARLRP